MMSQVEEHDRFYEAFHNLASNLMQILGKLLRTEHRFVQKCVYAIFSSISFLFCLDVSQLDDIVPQVRKLLAKAN